MIIFFISWIAIIFLLVAFVISSSRKKNSELPTNTPVKHKEYVNRSSNPEKEKLQKWISKKTDELLECKNLKSLLTEKKVLDIGYKDLLETIEWRLKRLKILIRDGFSCQNCSLVSESLHVHHKCYIKDEFPWEIHDSYLEALCYKCHKEKHESQIIPVYIKKSDGTLQPTDNKNIYCLRCSGAGWFPQFIHVEAGICFRCRGNCIERTIFSESLERFITFSLIEYDDNIINEILNFFSSLNVADYKERIKLIDSNINTDLPF